MSHARIGELLGQMVKLSGHDVEEILQEQSVTHSRFGDIALSWGLCRPEHIWRAWCQQIGDATPHVNVREIGVDAQATAYLPRSIARQYQVIPLRMIGHELLLAAAEDTLPAALRDIPSAVHMKRKFVVADAGDVREAIDRYYPPLTAAG
jgi:type IV pilus assembly protein PilB